VEVKAKRIKSTMMMHVPHRRRSSMLNQRFVDKENILLQPKTHQCQKSTRTIKSTTIITKGGWTIEYLEEAMNVMDKGVTSLRRASCH